MYFGSVSIKKKNVCNYIHNLFFDQNANQPQQIQYFLKNIVFWVGFH